MKNSGFIKNLAAFAIAAGIFWMSALTSLAAEGEVTSTANIRAQASTDSEVVASATKGKKIDILEAVKDGSGTVWYKVSVAGGGYGYIRSDMVKTSETITVSSTTTATTSQPASSSSQPAATVPTAIEEQSAVIKCESNARIRSGASTDHSVVTSLPNGTGVTLIGEANDNAGSKWYQIKCDYNNRSIEGYIKSNLVVLGQAPDADTSSEGEGGETPSEGEGSEGGEGENPEGGEGEAPEDYDPEPTPEESYSDYKVVWENEEYYLYDYTANEGAGGKTKITDIKSAIDYINVELPKVQQTAKTNKIIIIALAGVIVLLVIIITVLIFKIRSLYYDDYDEDEEEEEEPEPEPVRKKVRRRVEEEEEEPVPVRKKKPSSREESGQRAGERPARPKKDGQPELRAAERREGTKKPASRKPQNFLVDDDEFEFEFLNMDDKDL